MILRNSLFLISEILAEEEDEKGDLVKQETYQFTTASCF